MFAAIRDYFNPTPPAPVKPVGSSDTLSPTFKEDYSAVSYYTPSTASIWNGEKFEGGLGPVELLTLDYWGLRQRSTQLFRKNLYARGIISRLVTNEINTGLTPEACPDEEVLGAAEDSFNDWTDLAEARFHIWSKNPHLCDHKDAVTFGTLQRVARMEALIAGDILVVLRQDKVTKLPRVQLVDGADVQSPLQKKLAKGHYVEHGVEFDAQGRHYAYWVRQDDGTFKQVRAKGSRSGRRLAFMVYGLEKRVKDCRGEPILAIVLQSLQEIDRYRDSVQRKAVVNSIVAMFIEKTENKPSSLPMQGGAVKKAKVETQDGGNSARKLNATKHLPGTYFEELQVGEKPHFLGGNGTDTNFGTFEEAIIQAVAWANEIPPEILRLAFSNNYSASQAAINEFKIYLNKIWSAWGEQFCTPIYVEWLLSESLTGRFETPGLLKAWRDPKEYDTFGALTLVDWYGSIKPSTDMLKQAKGSEMLTENGWSTNARESRMNTGTKFKKNIKRLKRENQLKADAKRPLAEFAQEFNDAPSEEEAPPVPDEAALEAMLDDILEARGA